MSDRRARLLLRRLLVRKRHTSVVQRRRWLHAAAVCRLPLRTPGLRCTWAPRPRSRSRVPPRGRPLPGWAGQLHHRRLGVGSEVGRSPRRCARRLLVLHPAGARRSRRLAARWRSRRHWHQRRLLVTVTAQRRHKGGAAAADGSGLTGAGGAPPGEHHRPCRQPPRLAAHLSSRVMCRSTRRGGAGSHRCRTPLAGAGADTRAAGGGTAALGCAAAALGAAGCGTLWRPLPPADALAMAAAPQRRVQLLVQTNMRLHNVVAHAG